MRVLASLLTLALLAVPGFAQKFPKQLVFAKYVSVMTDGAETHMAETMEDRQARDRLETKLREWGRYVVTINPSQADLIFVIRRAGAVGGVGVGLPPIGSGPGTGPPRPTVGGRVSSSHDVLSVYSSGPFGDPNPIANDPSLINKGALWQQEMAQGLSTPQMGLLEAYKRDLNEAELYFASERNWKEAAKEIQKKVKELAKAAGFGGDRVKKVAEDIAAELKTDQQARLRVVKGDMTDVERLFREKTGAAANQDGKKEEKKN